MLGAAAAVQNIFEDTCHFEQNLEVKSCVNELSGMIN
jgi:hypothetical protein